MNSAQTPSSDAGPLLPCHNKATARPADADRAVAVLAEGTRRYEHLVMSTAGLVPALSRCSCFLVNELLVSLRFSNEGFTRGRPGLVLFQNLGNFRRGSHFTAFNLFFDLWQFFLWNNRHFFPVAVH